MDKDDHISNGELFQVLKMMVGTNLKDTQLQQIVDKTIIFADKDGDGKISFQEFCEVSSCTTELGLEFNTGCPERIIMHIFDLKYWNTYSIFSRISNLFCLSLCMN